MTTTNGTISSNGIKHGNGQMPTLSPYAHHFSLANIPFGIASSTEHPEPANATRILDTVVFLDVLADAGYFKGVEGLPLGVFKNSTLNPLAALSATTLSSLRSILQKLLHPDSLHILPPVSTTSIANTTLHLPIVISDFTDFSTSPHHNLNASQIVTGNRALPPGYLHFPTGYAGRASSIILSGTPVVRPWGQFRDKETKEVVYAQTRALDYEAEVGVVVGRPTRMGTRVPAAEADNHIFGFVLVNDWSARDIQTLEMPPLGPLNGKNFATSISPWVISPDALLPFSLAPEERPKNTAAHLKDPKPKTYNIAVEVVLTPKEEGSQASVLGKANVKDLTWTFRDMIAHQSAGGCPLRTGDLLASGTISGPGEGQAGCLLEASKGGKVGLKLVDGRERVWLEDGDLVSFTGVCGEGVGFGDVSGVIMPATAEG